MNFINVENAFTDARLATFNMTAIMMLVNEAGFNVVGKSENETTKMPTKLSHIAFWRVAYR